VAQRSHGIRYCERWGFDARRAVFVLTRSSACARCDVSVIKTILPYNSEPPMSAIRGVVSTIVLGSTTMPHDFEARYGYWQLPMATTAMVVITISPAVVVTEGYHTGGSASLHVRTTSLRCASHWGLGWMEFRLYEGQVPCLSLRLRTCVRCGGSANRLDASGWFACLRIASIAVGGGEGSALSVVWLQGVEHRNRPLMPFEPSRAIVIRPWPTSRVHKSG
jgi:hypothetical protein